MDNDDYPVLTTILRPGKVAVAAALPTVAALPPAPVIDVGLVRHSALLETRARIEAQVVADLDGQLDDLCTKALAAALPALRDSLRALVKQSVENAIKAELERARAHPQPLND